MIKDGMRALTERKEGHVRKTIFDIRTDLNLTQTQLSVIVDVTRISRYEQLKEEPRLIVKKRLMNNLDKYMRENQREYRREVLGIADNERMALDDIIWTREE